MEWTAYGVDDPGREFGQGTGSCFSRLRQPLAAGPGVPLGKNTVRRLKAGHAEDMTHQQPHSSSHPIHRIGPSTNRGLSLAEKFQKAGGHLRSFSCNLQQDASERQDEPNPRHSGAQPEGDRKWNVRSTLPWRDASARITDTPIAPPKLPGTPITATRPSSTSADCRTR